MTIHAAFSPKQQDQVPIAAAARIVALSPSRSAIFFDGPPVVVGRGERLSATLDGRPVEGPLAVTRLGLENGAERHVVLAPVPGDDLGRRTLIISVRNAILARIDPLALQSPFVDPLALIAGLDGTASLRLLKLLVTTGASLFGKGDIGAFGALADHLVGRLGTRLPLAGRCRIGQRTRILSWEIPSALELPPLHALYLLSDGRTTRMTDFEVSEEVSEGRRILHLTVFRPIPNDADFVIFSSRLLLLGMSREVAPRPLASWLARRGDAVRARTMDIVSKLAAEEADVVILQDELLCPAGSEPSLKVLHLSRGPAGLLYMIGVADPRGLLAGIRVETQDAHIDLPLDRLDWHSRHGVVAAGFASRFGRCASQATISPLYRSGRRGAASRAAVEVADALLPEAFRGLPTGVAAAALARSLPACIAARPAWRHRVTTFGSVRATCSVAVVIAAGSAPEHLHAAVAAVTAEAGRGPVELVIHHQDGPATETVLRAAEMLSSVHRIGLSVVSVASEALPSEALRAALRSVRAPKCVAMGKDVLPDGPGWLAACRRRIAGPLPRVVTAKATVVGGAEAGGYVVGLNDAARMRLGRSKPLLPSVLPDLHATPDLPVGGMKWDGFTTFGDAVDDPLADAVELLVLAETGEARDG